MAYFNRLLCYIVVLAILAAWCMARSINEERDDANDLAERQFSLRELVDALAGDVKLNRRRYY
jgi:hypothetical protein